MKVKSLILILTQFFFYLHQKPTTMKSTLLVILSVFYIGMVQAQTQYEMNEQAKREYDRADDELNKVYQKVLKKYSQNYKFIKNLRTAQRLWVEFKIAEVAVKFPETEDPYFSYGSVFPLCYYNFMRDITLERTQTLKEWLDEDIDICSGSVGEYQAPKRVE